MALFIGQDETLTCKDCGQQFTFTQGEQKFFDEQGFTDKPKRCKACRIAKKAAKAQQQNGDQQVRFPSDSNYPPQNYGNGYNNSHNNNGYNNNGGNGNGNGRPSRGNNRRNEWNNDDRGRGNRRNFNEDY